MKINDSKKLDQVSKFKIIDYAKNHKQNEVLIQFKILIIKNFFCYLKKYYISKNILKGTKYIII